MGQPSGWLFSCHNSALKKRLAATQMEKRGIQTEKRNVNRQIAADNKLLKEMKARIIRLY